MLEKYYNQMPDRSGGGSSNCGARRILSFFGLNIYEKKNLFFFLSSNLHKKKDSRQFE